MSQIFDSNFVVRRDGEYFWHATTIQQMLNMIQQNSSGLQPRGTGQLGPGFYVTSTVSDYQKGMARRSRPNPLQDEAEPPLFLFQVGVRDFYKLRPRFLTRWGPSSDGPETDFFAVCWYKGGSGGVGVPERGGFIPPVLDNPTAKPVAFKYGEYRQLGMFGTQIADMPEKDQMDFMNTLWDCTCNNTSPEFARLPRFAPFDRLLPWIGPKRMFRVLLLELAFKNTVCLEESRIVAVKVFSPTIEPVKLKFSFAGKSYDLTGAVPIGTSLRTYPSPLNFHEEVSLDLGKVINALDRPS